MANEPNVKDEDGAAKTAEAGADAKPKSKKKLLLAGGGAAAIVALGCMAALMAIPKKAVVHRMQGPFVARLSQADIQVNLAGESSKRYLVMSLQAEYATYDEAYVTARVGPAGGTGDPHYAAMLKDAMLRVAATRTRDQVTDPVLVAAFLEEVREAADGVLFPVCVGDSKSPRTEDTHSGLKLGESGLDSTMRGLLYEHSVHVDGPRATIALDGGVPVHFDGSELDLRVEGKDKKCVFLDVSGVHHDFLGDVPIGVAGKVRRIFRDSFLVQ